MGQWYKVEVYRGHQGRGYSSPVQAYIFANDAAGVLERYKKMPGVKRSIRIRPFFPNILPLPLTEALGLERRIIEEGRISLNKARRSWYYPEII